LKLGRGSERGGEYWMELNSEKDTLQLEKILSMEEAINPRLSTSLHSEISSLVLDDLL
jgi:hypothetical protein